MSSVVLDGPSASPRPRTKSTISGSSETSCPPHRPTASTLWDAFAHRIAGRPEYRTQNAAGQYLPASTRPITAQSPARPAAVMIYALDGTCTTLCLDFDAAKITPETLHGDLERTRTALTGAGIGFVEDHSISGGHHIYIPLAAPMHRDDTRHLVEHLAQTLTSLDPAPHRSIQSGCIRVPGSRHRRGGHQTLITGQEQALAVFDGPRAGIDALKLLAEAFPVVPKPSAPRPPGTAQTDRSARSSSRDLQLLATEGIIPERYSSPSEARMASLCSLAASGWKRDEVAAEMASGHFLGLQKLYSKYSSSDQVHTLTREWTKAISFIEKKSESKPGKKHGAKRDMNLANNSQRGDWDEHGFIRKVRSTLDVFDLRLRQELPPRQVPGAQLLLRAILAFGHMTSSRELAVGCRSLALATGQSHQTVARLLGQLSAMPGAPVQLKYKGSGLEADTYAIVADESLEALAERRGLARGSIHSLRPVFRVLGPVCALVYEAIERLGSSSMGELSKYTGFNRSTVRAAVYDMQVHQMVRQAAGEWRINHAISLTALARDLGGLNEFEAQLHRYRVQRRLWKAVVEAHHAATQGGPSVVYEEEMFDAEREVYWVPPEQAGRTGPELVLQAA